MKVVSKQNLAAINGGAIFIPSGWSATKVPNRDCISPVGAC